MLWEIAGEDMKTLQNWEETPMIFIKIIQQLSYYILCE